MSASISSVQVARVVGSGDSTRDTNFDLQHPRVEVVEEGLAEFGRLLNYTKLQICLPLQHAFRNLRSHAGRETRAHVSNAALCGTVVAHTYLPQVS